MAGGRGCQHSLSLRPASEQKQRHGPCYLGKRSFASWLLWALCRVILEHEARWRWGAEVDGPSQRSSPASSGSGRPWPGSRVTGKSFQGSCHARPSPVLLTV